ncbi:hypothetical protein [Pseudomonas tohonis]|uniref:hypothetical protein n=1 Tax=Pseudomonas tohonis TaxID=2725477 RepID=UPI001F3B1B7E|nr:hypothetical protein [Pseudomonas tohonis]
MTLATHCTQAPAARKRGGGPAQDLQMNARTLGRHPLPEGGEINSLCRAAAGIIPSLPAGSGAHVYPTECVRGGAVDVHRSANPQLPAAQPVKGYTTSISELDVRHKLLMNDLRHFHMVLEKPNVVSVLVRSNVYILQRIGNLHCVRRTSLEITQRAEFPRTEVGHRQARQTVHVSPELLVVTVREVSIDRRVTKVVHCLVEGPIKKRYVLDLKLTVHDQEFSKTLLLLLAPQNVVPNGQTRSRQNCDYRSERLHPVGSLRELAKKLQDCEQQPAESQESQESPQNPNDRYGQFRKLHRLPFSFDGTLRLPFAASLVHGGAA